MMNIDLASRIAGSGAIGLTGSNSGSAPTGESAGGLSFAATLEKALGSVNQMQIQAQNGARDLAAGTAANIHDVTIAMEQANVALQLTATVRNRAVEAYQEIMRMTV